MKPFFSILLVWLFATGLSAQTQGNSIIANLIKLSDSTVAVDFVVGPSANLTGTGNPISVLLRIPTSQLPDAMSVMLLSSSVGLALAQSVDDGNGYFIYYYEGPAVDLNSPAWDNGVTTRIGVFKITGSPTIQLSGGQYGPPTSNGSGGFTWPGTALLTNNTETNLVSWPITASLALPLQLTEFNLNKSGVYAQLQWTTWTEFNTDRFDIQRSTDNVSWETLTQVAAAGQSSTKRTYQYQDPLHHTSRNPSAVLYYRIKSIDLDQSFTFTEVKSIQMGPGASLTLKNTLVRDRLIVQYNGMNEGALEFKILDIQGKVFSVFKASVQEANGTIEFTQGMDQLPAGVYHLVGMNRQSSVPAIRFVKLGS